MCLWTKPPPCGTHSLYPLQAQLEYDYFTYAHLGKYRCPGCGYCRETPDYNVTDIVETTPDSSTVMLNGTTPVKINLGGVYNIYNGIGALAALVSLGIDRETALHALERFSGAFGGWRSLAMCG